MTAIYLFVVNCILSFVSSQLPINISGWELLSASPTPNDKCEAIGGYDYANDVIKMYGGTTNGGSDQAKYIYDPDTRTYTYTNLSALSYTVTEISASAQRHGASAENILYYVDGLNIMGIDMADDTRATYATLDDNVNDDTQINPGLCMDDATNTLYVVGFNQVEKCALDSSAPQTCIVTEQNEIDRIVEPACEYYNGVLYIFGGADEGGTKTTIWKCDPPDTAASCQAIPAVLGFARANIRTVKIECFNNNYIALIGGRTNNAGDPSGGVELFDLASDSITDGWPTLNQVRKNFVGVFDIVREQIFVFGGAIGASCTDLPEVTMSGPEGICYTSAPTMDPTVDPTIDPTTNPSKSPSNVPSTAPTESPLIPTPKPVDEEYVPETGGFTTKPSSYGIIIAILVIVCCIILICFAWYAREEKQHEYGRMVAVVAADTSVPMVAVVVTCDSCKQATPCACGSCNKCGKTSCATDCGTQCNNCGTTQCDGNACRQS